MKQQGYTCMGVTMKLYDNEEIGVSSEKTCCTLKDVEDARFVAQALDMPYYVLNFKDKFEEEVIQRFVDTYIEGGTPNPCIDCNHRIKFRGSHAADGRAGLRLCGDRPLRPDFL